MLPKTTLVPAIVVGLLVLLYLLPLRAYFDTHTAVLFTNDTAVPVKNETAANAVAVTVPNATVTDDHERWYPDFAVLAEANSVTVEQLQGKYATFSVERGLELLRLMDADVRTELLWTQRPPNCKTARLAVMEMHISGFGSTWQQFVQFLMAAHSVVGGSMVVRGTWGYANGCSFGNKSKSVDCFFELPTSCRVDDLAVSKKDKDDSERAEVSLGDARNHNRVVFLSKVTDFLLGSTEGHNLDYYPPKYHSFGVPFWRIRVNRFMLDSMRPDVRQAIEAKRAGIAWPSAGTPVIGIHIRRGDKVNEDFEMYSLDTYLARALKLKEAHGARHVFIATDSAKELQTILSLHTWTSMFEILYLNDTVRLGDQITEAASETRRQQDGYLHGLDVLSNLVLLSDANYFVGSPHSNMARVAVDWMDAKYNLLAPPEWIEFKTGADGVQYLPANGKQVELASLYYATYNRTAMLEEVWCFQREKLGLDLPPAHCK